jgi:hypothetical protein
VPIDIKKEYSSGLEKGSKALESISDGFVVKIAD